MTHLNVRLWPDLLPLCYSSFFFCPPTHLFSSASLAPHRLTSTIQPLKWPHSCHLCSPAPCLTTCASVRHRVSLYITSVWFFCIIYCFHSPELRTEPKPNECNNQQTVCWRIFFLSNYLLKAPRVTCQRTWNGIKTNMYDISLTK